MYYKLYHLTAKERLFWRKKVLQMKILEFGRAKLAARAMFEKRYWKN